LPARAARFERCECEASPIAVSAELVTAAFDLLHVLERECVLFFFPGRRHAKAHPIVRPERG